MFIPMKSMISTRPKIYTSLREVDKHSRWMVCLVMVWWMSCVVVAIVWRKTCVEGPRLGALVDLVEFDDGVTSGGVALFKTVEALSRGAFFFSTGVELKTKGAGGGGAGREMMDSNTSLLEILTPKHFLAVSAIRFDRSDFACTCLSGKVLVQNCG